jgi:hypothetical protein
MGCGLSVSTARVFGVGFGPSGPVLLRTTRASHLPRVCWRARVRGWGRPGPEPTFWSHVSGRHQEVMFTPTTERGDRAGAR